MATLKAAEAELFHKEAGAGPPLLLIHGSGCHADVWDNVLGQLGQKARAIAYDRRGYRRSAGPASPPAGYFRAHADDAAALLAALGAAPATIVGWSAGGIIALHLAVAHPQAVRALVLVEPPLHCKTHPNFFMLRNFIKLNLQKAFGKRERAAETFFRFAMTYRTGGTGFDRLDPQMRASLLEQRDTLLAELDAGTGEELKPAELAKVGCPVKILVGELTPDVFRLAAERLHRALPKSELVRVPQAAHALHLDQPAQFVAQVHAAVS